MTRILFLKQRFWEYSLHHKLVRAHFKRVFFLSLSVLPWLRLRLVGTADPCISSTWSYIMRHAVHPEEVIISSLSSSGKALLSWLTWTALVTALSDFLSAAIALLPRHRCPLTHPRSPLPSAVTGLRAAAPRAPRVPLAVGCNTIINQKAILSCSLTIFNISFFFTLSDVFLFVNMQGRLSSFSFQFVVVMQC